ncbi:short chain dehydrogenase family protein, partial [Vibrio parahaemolyticus EKP-008]
PIK